MHRGVSQGTANVEFVHAADATSATEDYNGVHLDGKPMRIQQMMIDGEQLSSGLKYVSPASYCSLLLTSPYQGSTGCLQELRAARNKMSFRLPANMVSMC